MIDRIKIEGDEEFIRYTHLVQERGRRWLRGLVAGMANYTLHWARIYAPDGPTGYIQRHLDATGAQFRPGGAGGGGSYEAVAGVKRGDSKHPLYVHQGTGLYSYRHDFIRPNKAGGVLAFEKKGEPTVFTKKVKGQEAQPYVYGAYKQTILYARARVVQFGPEVLRSITN